MSGLFLRVNREGEWLNIEVEHLSDEERDIALSERTSDELLRWINALCSTLNRSETMTEGETDD